MRPKTLCACSKALLALGCMEHRGACSADNDSGDGAGVMTAVPWDLLKAELPDLDLHEKTTGWVAACTAGKAGGGSEYKCSGPCACYRRFKLGKFRCRSCAAAGAGAVILVEKERAAAAGTAMVKRREAQPGSLQRHTCCSMPEHRRNNCVTALPLAPQGGHAVPAEQ